MKSELERLAEKHAELSPSVRGIGMVWGLELPQPGVAGDASKAAFERGLILETAGANDEVLKFLPALVIEEELLREGFDIVDQALTAVLEQRHKTMGVS
jgi:diaminobutyrate-2-oxoglutarate transaminase